MSGWKLATAAIGASELCGSGLVPRLCVTVVVRAHTDLGDGAASTAYRP
jgi:hypothetical protein